MINLGKILSMAKKEKTPSPKTIVANTKQRSYFLNPQRDLQKYENIYRQGGLVSQAIDSYALFAVSGGYTLEGTGNEKVEKWFEEIDAIQMMWQSIVDAYVYGDCILENVIGRGGEIQYLVPRNPSYFTINFDRYGIIQSYTQRVDDKATTLQPHQVTHYSLIPISGENYGLSLLARAFDDVMRDTRTAESTAVAIERHGYPRYHIKAGDLEHDTEYQDEDKRAIAREFQELKADNEFVSNPDIEIVPIDVQGVNKIASYNEWSLSRLLGAMGVPSQVLGTGEATTTYATASVEVVSFIKRVRAIQRVVARHFNQVIDMKTGVPGQVKLELNEPDMQGLANVNPKKEEV